MKYQADILRKINEYCNHKTHLHPQDLLFIQAIVESTMPYYYECIVIIT
jgi:hypothetical protein